MVLLDHSLVNSFVRGILRNQKGLHEQHAHDGLRYNGDWRWSWSGSSNRGRFCRKTRIIEHKLLNLWNGIGKVQAEGSEEAKVLHDFDELAGRISGAEVVPSIRSVEDAIWQS